MSSDSSRPGAVADRPPDVVPFLRVYAALLVVLLADALAPTVAGGVADAVPASTPGWSLVAQPWPWTAFGTLLLGVGYARRFGADPSVVGRPAVGARVLALATLGPLGIAATLAGAVAVLFDAGAAAAGPVPIAIDPPLAELPWLVGVPVLIVGVSHAVLFFGAIQPHLRDHHGPDAAVLAAGILAGLFHWFVDPIGTVRPSLALTAGFAGLVTATTYATVLLVRAWDADSLAGVRSPAGVVALGATSLLATGVLVEVFAGGTTGPELLAALAWLATTVVAARVRETSASLGLAALTVVVFAAAFRLWPYLTGGPSPA